MTENPFKKMPLVDVVVVEAAVAVRHCLVRAILGMEGED
jgi:hypothetical protein